MQNRYDESNDGTQNGKWRDHRTVSEPIIERTKDTLTRPLQIFFLPHKVLDHGVLGASAFRPHIIKRSPHRNHHDASQYDAVCTLQFSLKQFEFLSKLLKSTHPAVRLRRARVPLNPANTLSVPYCDAL